jgi:DNA-directed RNA polymerase subunit K/omega
VLDRTWIEKRSPLQVPTRRKTSCYLTKYELAGVLALRAEELSHGGPPRLSASELRTCRADVVAIARLEVRLRRLEYVVRRNLPNGAREDWPLRDLRIPPDIDLLSHAS